MLGCVAMDIAPLCLTALWGVGSGCLCLWFQWCDGQSGLGGISEVAGPEGCFVWSHWSLLPVGQVAIELHDHSLLGLLPDFPSWSNMFLISPGGSCVIPLLLWLWLVSTSPNKVGARPIISRVKLCILLYPPPVRGELCSPSMAFSFAHGVCNLPMSWAGPLGSCEGRWSVVFSAGVADNCGSVGSDRPGADGLSLCNTGPVHCTI
jgi:hypothetical protein